MAAEWPFCVTTTRCWRKTYQTATKVAALILWWFFESLNQVQLLNYIPQCIHHEGQTKAAFETTCYTSSMYWFGQNVACSMHYANKSKICSMPKIPTCCIYSEKKLNNSMHSTSLPHLLCPTMQSTGTVTQPNPNVHTQGLMDFEVHSC